MTTVGQLLLASENFRENVVEHLKQIWRSQDFTDVTLVSSDGSKVEAHKTVLSSSSSFFREILKFEKTKHSGSMLLYMRGVSHKELDLLMEFIYTGECEVEVAELKEVLMPCLMCSAVYKNNFDILETCFKESANISAGQHHFLNSIITC